jgi:transposase
VAGRKSGDAVAHLISRFNREGLPALETRHGGGPPFRYTSVEGERILQEFRRPPDRRLDGTATWSLVTLQRALQRAPDGLPHVSTQTIGCVLHARRLQLAKRSHLVEDRHGPSGAQKWDR